MDKKKRTTLKLLSITAVSAALGGVSSSLFKHGAASATDSTDLAVRLEHSWGGSNADIVIKNISSQPLRIAAISPARIPLEAGCFELAGACSANPDELAPGAEIRVPYKPTATPAFSVRMGHFDRSLQKTLKRQLQILTADKRPARLSVAMNPHIV